MAGDSRHVPFGESYGDLTGWNRLHRDEFVDKQGTGDLKKQNEEAGKKFDKSQKLRKEK